MAIGHSISVCCRRSILLSLIPFRRLDAKQMMDEKVLQQPLTIGASRPVPAAGNEQQVELFVGFDQRVDNLKSRGRIYVRVHLWDYKQQLSLQPVGVIHIGRGRVMGAERPSHPLFIPPHLIHPVIVAAAIGEGTSSTDRNSSGGG